MQAWQILWAWSPSAVNGNISSDPLFTLCSTFSQPCAQHMSWTLQGSQMCSTLSQSCATRVLFGRKNTHMTQQHSSPFLRPARSVSAYPSLKLLFLHHGDESCWISTLSTASTAILQVEENQLSPSFAKVIMIMSLTACRLESISGCLPVFKKWSRQNRLAHLEAILLFCRTFTYIPSAAFATRGTPPVPCCLAAGLGTVWAQSTRWEMSWRRG